MRLVWSIHVWTEVSFAYVKNMFPKIKSCFHRREGRLIAQLPCLFQYCSLKVQIMPH